LNSAGQWEIGGREQFGALGGQEFADVLLAKTLK